MRFASELVLETKRPSRSIVPPRSEQYLQFSGASGILSQPLGELSGARFARRFLLSPMGSERERFARGDQRRDVWIFAGGGLLKKGERERP